MSKSKEITEMWKEIRPKLGKMINLCHQIESRAELHDNVTANAFQMGYDAACKDIDIKSKINAAYRKGMEDAWYAARTLWNTPNRKEIFGHTTFNTVLTTLTAQEAIEKIRQYEQEKEEQIQVGDEVATDAGNRASVLYENPDGTQVFVFKSDGTAAWWTKSALHRTGRNFPEVATILEKMRGEQDD